MKISVCYVHWILLLVTFVSSCFFFVLVACEVQPSALQQIVVNGSIVHSTGTITSADNSIKKELDLSDTISPSSIVRNQEVETEVARSTEPDRQEDAATVHSSFADAETKPSWSASEVIGQSPSDVNISPEIVTEFNNGLTDTSQAAVLTLLESATTELHKQLQTEGLSASLSEGPGSDNLTVETPTQQPPVQDLPDRENRTREDTEHNQYATHAEPKVLEVRYNVVDVEAVILPALNKKVTVVSDEVKEVEPAPGEDKPAPVARDPAGTPTPDEIPSFSEWAQKKMEEAEKKVLNGSLTGGLSPPRPPSSSKLRSKNYASPDCGAKIVASNPEAESANSVLSPSRDEYVLNACVNRIWLVVELCEAIQAKKIDIANFELFSSSPKDFSVSVSDRFPSRDWRSVGQLTAKDIRDVQSYDLHPHLFGKFVKVEFHSHYGSEHYCPVSMIRVYGTSEFEVLETEVEAHHATQEIDEDLEEGTLEAGDPGDPPRNLFGSARAVVMSLVKKATEALVKGGEAANTTTPGDGDDSQSPYQEASTPSHLIVCHNCSDTLYNYVWEMLGHRQKELYQFVQVPFVRDALRSGPVCAEYGLDFGRRRPLNYPSRPDPGDYLKSLLPDSYVAALCNALAVIERKVVLNASQESNTTTAANTTDPGESQLNTEYEGVLLPTAATCSVATPPAPEDTPPLATSSQIRPTKTLTEAEIHEGLFSSSTRLPDDPVDPPRDPPTLEVVPPTPENATDPSPSPEGTLEPTQTSDNPEDPADSTETFQPEEDPTLDTLLSELKDLDPSLDVTSPPTTTATLPPQKESVFVRISNRIKALERNMSLSSQYLEELSRRYKKQVEEISRTLNRTLAAAETEAKRREELEQKGSEELTALREEIATLTAAVNTLMVDRDGAMVVSQHVVLIAIEMLFFVGVLCLCLRMPAHEGAERRWSLAWGRKVEPPPVARRKSLEAVGGKARRKRPSEVALNIAGTYTDLLIKEPRPSGAEAGWTAPKAETKRRRRRKKENGLPKSSSSVSLQHKTSRKTSTNSSSGCGSAPYESGDVRRASLSELGGSFWLPVDGSEDLWTRGQTEPQPTADVRTEQCVISVPERTRTIATLCDSNGLPKYRSLPSFMKTASSTRADRRPSDVSRQSSQTSLVPTPSNGDVSDKGSEAELKKPKGFKKMVKRFF